MLTAIVAVVYILVIAFDFIPHRKERAALTSVVYCVLLCVSFVVLVLYSLDIRLPGPSEAITHIVEKLFKLPA